MRSVLFTALTLVMGALALGGCRSDEPKEPMRLMEHAPPRTPAAAPTLERVYGASRADCTQAAVYIAGAPRGFVCVTDAATEGLTVVDLSDTWTPRIFARNARDPNGPAYRAKYLELAARKNGDLGLNGVAPNLSITARRLADDKRVACHAAIDRAPLEEAAAALEDGTKKKSKRPSKAVTKVIQSELACAGLLKSRHVTGYLGRGTTYKLEAFRRRNMIVGRGVDTDTMRALALGGEELAFRAVLRALRERVADASGLLEDGTAAAARAKVVGRELDLSRFGPADAQPIENGAPDLIGRATDRAAVELGWTSPDAARAFVNQHRAGLGSLLVAVALPETPDYHSAAMDIRVEIDRGDVFYETPGVAAAKRRKLSAPRRPTFVVYAKDGEREVALMRWSTTIGGWKRERTEDGEIALKYKESDVGDRVWRQVIAAPAWLPPDSTPESDLIYESKDGDLSLKRSLIQPGIRNAYGLAMLIHHRPVVKGDKTVWHDRGIRTHGSVHYSSIEKGTSHGCHRLYNQLVLRLTGFLLHHRSHVARGTMHAGYQRTLEYKDETIEVAVPKRGYLYELDPPVPVRVLEGRVAGSTREPVSVIRLANEPAKT